MTKKYFSMPTSCSFMTHRKISVIKANKTRYI